MPTQPSYSVPLDQGAPFAVTTGASGPGENFQLPLGFTAQRRILIEAIRVKLACDATTADRRLILVRDAPGGLDMILEMDVIQTANEAFTYFLRPQHEFSITTIGSNRYGPMFAPFLISGLDFGLEIEVDNIQSGDGLLEILLMGRQWMERSE